MKNVRAPRFIPIDQNAETCNGDEVHHFDDRNYRTSSLIDWRISDIATLYNSCGLYAQALCRSFPLRARNPVHAPMHDHAQRDSSPKDLYLRGAAICFCSGLTHISMFKALGTKCPPW